MSNDQPVYTVETSKGNHDFTTPQPHTLWGHIDQFLKAHDSLLKTITNGAIIYGVYMTHHGRRTKLK